MSAVRHHRASPGGVPCLPGAFQTSSRTHSEPWASARAERRIHERTSLPSARFPVAVPRNLRSSTPRWSSGICPAGPQRSLTAAAPSLESGAVSVHEVSFVLFNLCFAESVPRRSPKPVTRIPSPAVFPLLAARFSHKKICKTNPIYSFVCNIGPSKQSQTNPIFWLSGRSLPGETSLRPCGGARLLPISSATLRPGNQITPLLPCHRGGPVRHPVSCGSSPRPDRLLPAPLPHRAP